MDIGRSFNMFCQFISQIKEGKKCIMFGPGYVVLDRGSYDALVDKKEQEHTAVWLDEATEISEESWVEKFYKEAHK